MRWIVDLRMAPPGQQPLESKDAGPVRRCGCAVRGVWVKGREVEMDRGVDGDRRGGHPWKRPRPRRGRLRRTSTPGTQLYTDRLSVVVIANLIVPYRNGVGARPRTT